MIRSGIVPAIRSSICGSIIPADVINEDLDAAAYLSAVILAGATVTAPQRAAIDDFVRAEKLSGRWDSSHKRIFFPVWGVAAANAICMRSLTNGTWVNSPTQAAGYVQGNGSTQYFNTGAGPITVGMTDSSAHIWCGINVAESRNSLFTFIGNQNGISTRIYQDISTSLSGDHPNTSSKATGGVAATNGILSLFATSNGSRKLRRRNSAGIANEFTHSGVASSSLLNTNFFALARSVSGSPSQHTNAGFFGFGYGLGMSDANDAAFTLNMKTLWETVTGLALP